MDEGEFYVIKQKVQAKPELFYLTFLYFLFRNFILID